MPKVLVAVPGEDVKIQQITEGMKSLHTLIDGSLDCFQLGKGFTLYCNQEGTDRDLPLNTHFARGIIKGPFVIAKTDSQGNALGLDDQDLHFITHTFLRNES